MDSYGRSCSSSRKSPTSSTASNFYQTCFEAKHQMMAEESLDEPHHLLKQEKLIDALACIVQYGQPDHNDDFELTLAAHQSSGHLPLWAAEIKRCRTEDPDWYEGCEKHKDLILNQLRRYVDPDAGRDNYDGWNTLNVVLPGVDTLPKAVFYMLPAWAAMFVGMGSKGKARYDPEMDPVAVCHQVATLVSIVPKTMGFPTVEAFEQYGQQNCLGIVFVAAAARAYAIDNDIYSGKQTATSSRVTLSVLLPNGACDDRLGVIDRTWQRALRDARFASPLDGSSSPPCACSNCGMERLADQLCALLCDGDLSNLSLKTLGAYSANLKKRQSDFNQDCENADTVGNDRQEKADGFMSPEASFKLDKIAASICEIGKTIPKRKGIKV